MRIKHYVLPDWLSSIISRAVHFFFPLLQWRENGIEWRWILVTCFWYLVTGQQSLVAGYYSALSIAHGA
jgi:hypothetical protein